MFTNISWANYILFVILLLSVWYLFIVVKFYYHDLQNFVARKRKSNPLADYGNFSRDERKVIKNPKSTSDQMESSETSIVFEEVEELTAKLKEAIADASYKNYNKQEFIYLLQKTIKEYPNLKSSVFQVPINNLIIADCEKYGSIQLSADELVMLWKEIA